MRGEYLYFGFTKKASKGKKKYAAFPFPVSFHGFLLRVVLALPMLPFFFKGVSLIFD